MTQTPQKWASSPVIVMSSVSMRQKETVFVNNYYNKVMAVSMVTVSSMSPMMVSIHVMEESFSSLTQFPAISRYYLFSDGCV